MAKKIINPQNAGVARGKYDNLLRALVLALAAAWFLADIGGRDVFSWMDPWQYFGYARAMVAGETPAGGFEVPTLFPHVIALFLVFDPAGSVALLGNGVFLLLLLGGAMRLSRVLEIPAPPALAGLLVLAGPLVTGLTRELYSETALAAMVTWAMVYWLRVYDPGTMQPAKPGNLLGLGVFAALAVLMKITAPLFFIGPFAVVVGFALTGRHWRHLGALCGTFAAGFGGAFGVLWLVHPRARGYFTSLGNTEIPVMELIGPVDRWSWASVQYYPRVILVLLLGLLTLHLLLALVMCLLPGARDRLPRATLLLWAWFAVPPLLLIFQTTKEPRHILPCIVPAAVLIVWALALIRSRAWRIVGWSSLGGVLVLQAFLTGSLITAGSLPYLIRGTTGLPGLLRQLRAEAPLRVDDEDPETEPLALWAWRRNIILAGMPPNEALALQWLLRPSPVIYLNPALSSGSTSSPRNIATQRFEDPFLYTAFSTYNLRCWFPRDFQILTREEIVTHADILILGSEGEFDGAGVAENLFAMEIGSEGILTPTIRRPLFQFSQWFGQRRYLVYVFPPSEVTYRRLYLEHALDRADPGDVAALKAIRREIMTDFILTTDAAVLENPVRARDLYGLPREYPSLFDPDEPLPPHVPAKRLHWFGVYELIDSLRLRRIAALFPQEMMTQDARRRLTRVYQDSPVDPPMPEPPESAGENPH